MCVYVVTGQGGRAEEDLACAEHVRALVEGRPPPQDTVRRVRGSTAAAGLAEGAGHGWPGVAADDVDLACELDRFDFALVARTSSEPSRLRLDTYDVVRMDGPVTVGSMTMSPQEPVNAAEEDPTVQPGGQSDAQGVPTAQDPPVSEQVSEEDDLSGDESEDEVQVGLGPDS